MLSGGAEPPTPRRLLKFSPSGCQTPPRRAVPPKACSPPGCEDTVRRGGGTVVAWPGVGLGGGWG